MTDALILAAFVALSIGVVAAVYRRTRRRTKPPLQRTWCFCPGCETDLCSSPETTCTDTDLVRYVCGVCGTWSEWTFDAAPVPILLTHKTRGDA